MIYLEPFGVRASATGLRHDQLRDLAREHHLLVLEDLPAPGSAEQFSQWCEGLGQIMMWPFGAVLELVEADSPTDHIFDHSYVPMHWDGMYKPFIPEFQVFQCVSEPGAGHGGRTTFCDTTKLLRELDPDLLAAWREVVVTYRIQNVVHYGGKAVSPLVVPHPRTGEPTLRYNEPPIEDDESFLNRPLHEFAGTEDVVVLKEELRKALYDPRYFYAHDWRAGDVVITDNHALLHGRETFTHRAPRHLRRVHVLGDPQFANPAVA
ncbi:TauD/TfdA family dioxygenase [Kutzneria viridogrisea]|uniref:Alpha-ketoglutarate-dependent taurine dioxygenase n=1 Tax=Kutzneria viridogrisea TaxID=47990 RepID=A0ABR6BE12_9PSEU|nr:alpha-ketoglutarate-dependent taurine dioxygenase [Kutzneria viridogrisea]